MPIGYRRGQTGNSSHEKCPSRLIYPTNRSKSLQSKIQHKPMPILYHEHRLGIICTFQIFMSLWDLEFNNHPNMARIPRHIYSPGSLE